MSIAEFEKLLEDTKKRLKTILRDDPVYKESVKYILVDAYRQLTNDFEEQTFIENIGEFWRDLVQKEIVGA